MKTLTLAAIGGGVLSTILSFSFTAKADNHIFYGIQMEQFEYRSGDEGENLFVWDGDAFVGTDELKLRWQGEGERDLKNDLYENFENRLVLQTPISDFSMPKPVFVWIRQAQQIVGMEPLESWGLLLNGLKSTLICLSARPETAVRGLMLSMKAC